MRSAGSHEVHINRKRDGGDGEDPGGQSDDTLEERLLLVEELRKRAKREILISQKMSLAYPLKRKEIVVPMVSEVLEGWPALSLPNKVNTIVLTGSI